MAPVGATGTGLKLGVNLAADGASTGEVTNAPGGRTSALLLTIAVSGRGLGVSADAGGLGVSSAISSGGGGGGSSAHASVADGRLRTQAGRGPVPEQALCGV